VKEPKSRDKSRILYENQLDLLGFSVFELFDQLEQYYNRKIFMRKLEILELTSGLKGWVEILPNDTIEFHDLTD